jgi:hypothetical protein
MLDSATSSSQTGGSSDLHKGISRLALTPNMNTGNISLLPEKFKLLIYVLASSACAQGKHHSCLKSSS